MTQNTVKEKTDEQIWDEYLAKRSKATLYIMTITIVVIAIFGGIGYLLDMWLGTKPVIMVMAILFSFPVGQMAIYKKIKKDLL